MKSFEFSNKRIQSIWIVIFLLVIITIGIIIGCGKLTEDEYPGSPVGTSGGTMPIPIGPQSSWGTYSLTVWAHPPIIPADGVSYATVKAQLEDTSGRSLENFLISFNTTSSDTICQFVSPPSQPGSSGSYTPTIQALTGEAGKVSVLLYGMQVGSCVVQASIDIDEDGTEDLFTTTLLMITGGLGVPGDEIPGVYLTADQRSKSTNAGTCNEDCAEIDFTLTAGVWDQSGAKVGAGVRVEFYEGGTLVDWDNTNSSGDATYTRTSPTLCPTTPSGTSWSTTVLAEAYIGGTRYTDTETITATVTCAAATPTPVPSLTVSANPTTLSLAGANISDIQACTSDTAAGVTVTFALSPASTATGTIAPLTAVTDASGCTPVGTVIFTATGPPAGGTATITASATGYTTGSSPTITVNP